MDISTIEKKIYIIRGTRVMLDTDLADLYGVETKVLNQAVKRNISRFPDDFMFQLGKEEIQQIANNNSSLKDNFILRNSIPFVFTENGIAMLSSVLKSERAIQMNIQIMRLFTTLRNFLSLEENINGRIDALELETSKTFKIVFEEFELIKKSRTPMIDVRRKKIGLNEK